MICIVLKNTLLVQAVGAVIIQGFDFLFAGFGFVYRMFSFICQSWPFAVAVDFGRCMRMRSDVNPGQVVNNLLSMAWIQVDGKGDIYVWCINLARSDLMIILLYAMFAQICFVVVVSLTLGTKYIVHRPVVGSLCLMVVSFCSWMRMTGVGSTLCCILRHTVSLAI